MYRMNRERMKLKQRKRLTLSTESVRKLGAPDLAGAVGADQSAHCDTITLKCCLTR